MKKLIAFILIFVSFKSSAQDLASDIEINKKNYEAFQELKGMLTDSIKLEFKRAVFTTENAYLNNNLDFDSFNEHVKYLASKAELIAEQSDLLYSESDKEKVAKFAAVFRLMTDSVKFYTDTIKYFISLPYKYDFEDFWGEKDWRQMFVSKLLMSHKGNCHSLPFLYKMVCEEMGVKPYLSMAPNHTYIKIWCKKTGWFNTELTSGYFPIDAWIMASGYVHLSSVQNRVYMDTLSDKQSIAVCLIDLAKGYEKKFGDFANRDFIMKSCDLALRHYPSYVNGLILRAETLKKSFDGFISKSSAKYPSDVFGIPEAKKIFDEMENQYLQIHRLGYRQMPKEMYLNWLADLKTEKEKYLNKDLSKSLNNKERKP